MNLSQGDLQSSVASQADVRKVYQAPTLVELEIGKGTQGKKGVGTGEGTSPGSPS